MALTRRQRDTLTVVVDTFVPALSVPDDQEGFYARAGSAIGTDAAVERFLMTRLSAEDVASLGGLLDALADAGILDATLEAREAILRAVAGSGPDAAGAIGSLRTLSLLYAMSLTDETGRNPFWSAIGYPGPLSPPPATPKTLRVCSPPDGIEADIVVVGSGSGGGVISAELAAAGRNVVVLEAGGYYNEADFTQLELWAYEHLFLRGGVFQTADQNVTIAAGGAVGGGSTINWSNAVRPPKELLGNWAVEHGICDLPSDEFEAHIDAVYASPPTIEWRSRTRRTSSSPRGRPRSATTTAAPT